MQAQDVLTFFNLQWRNWDYESIAIRVNMNYKHQPFVPRKRTVCMVGMVYGNLQTASQNESQA